MTPFDVLAFTKMEALGNDFVIFDGRENPVSLKIPHIHKIADRRLGIGCDQILVLKTSAKADIKISIFNADGSVAEMCGNGMRAVAHYLDLTHKSSFETDAGIISAEVLNSSHIRVGMGEVKEVTTIHIAKPLADKMKNPPLQSSRKSSERIEDDYPESIVKPHCGSRISASLPKQSLGSTSFRDDDGRSRPSLWQVLSIPNLQLDMGFSINLGNPHAVFFVENLDSLDIVHLGPHIENDPQFPHKTNVEFAKVISENRIEVRIWERGVGETLACGSGACSVALAYWHHFGVKSDSVEVIMRGGALNVSRSGSEIYQEGPARFVFKGILTPEFFHDE